MPDAKASTATGTAPLTSRKSSDSTDNSRPSHIAAQPVSALLQWTFVHVYQLETCHIPVGAQDHSVDIETEQ